MKMGLSIVREPLAHRRRQEAASCNGYLRSSPAADATIPSTEKANPRNQ
jgi:hypothetical protein